jgi:protein phosphatase PTC7
MIPHPDKEHRGGEDAFYASENLLVVADGVGGWNAQGVDPSKYSRFLCSA